MNLLPTFGDIFLDPGSILTFSYPNPPPKFLEIFISLFSPMRDTWLESPGSQDFRTLFIFSVGTRFLVQKTSFFKLSFLPFTQNAISA